MNKEEWLRAIKKFRENGSAMLGLVLMILFIIIAIFAPLLAPVQIPENPELKKSKELIAQKSSQNEVIQSFLDFNNNMYQFYLQNFDRILILEDKLDQYKNDKKTERSLLDYITSLTSEFVIDQSYSEKWEIITETSDKKSSKEKQRRKKIKKEKRKIVASLNNEIKRFKVKVKNSEEVNQIISGLQNSKNFDKEVHQVYKKLNKVYVNSININPFLMPNVTWNKTPVPPSRKNFFGVSEGKDIYYGVIWGTRTGFRIGIIVVIISTVIGLFIGSIAAYYGGWVDEILMRFTDIFLSVPFMLSAIVLTTMLGSGLDKVMIAMIVFRWMAPARLIRGNILQTKNEQYVLASKAIGVPDWKIIIKHILPNTIFPVIILASMRMGSLVITAAALSFLGVGAPQGYADWGSILSYARNWMIGGSIDRPFQYWYLVFFPGTAMVLFVLAWNLIGDALRDIFDPKLRI